jgi:hypothetical protein
MDGNQPATGGESVAGFPPDGLNGITNGRAVPAQYTAPGSIAQRREIPN